MICKELTCEQETDNGYSENIVSVKNILKSLTNKLERVAKESWALSERIELMKNVS